MISIENAISNFLDIFMSTKFIYQYNYNFQRPQNVNQDYIRSGD